jgi:MFS family permease
LKLSNTITWPSILGVLFFIGMMATGYYYNLTFVQFGLLDLGTRLIGMSDAGVARYMAYLALITSLTALLVGYGMKRLGWTRKLRSKLKMAFIVVLAQTLLTAVAPLLRSQGAFLGWIVLASISLGIGVPATFSMTVDLVPVRWRGMVAAAITALAYFPAAVLSSNWTIEQFQSILVWVMLAGTLGLGVLAFIKFEYIERLALQHRSKNFWRGRFIRLDSNGRPHIRGSLMLLILLMFGIFFIDSLGFLRLAHSPFFFESAWQSPEIGPRLAIGVTHAIAALVAGLLYSALNEKELFLWIFGIFALVQLMYTLSAGRMQVGEPPLAMPVMYAVAVSLYTVLNFAIWADISTPETISRNSALGVALSGWTATFLSTALALQMRLNGVTLQTHLRIVDSLAMLFFLFVILLIFFSPRGRHTSA